MSEENLYKNPKGILTITKFTSSLKDKLVTFILSFEIDELNSLNIFEKDLSKENLEQKLNSLINYKI